MEQELLSIAERYHALPTLDNRTEEEILGYDDPKGYTEPMASVFFKRLEVDSHRRS